MKFRSYFQGLVLGAIFLLAFFFSQSVIADGFKIGGNGYQCLAGVENRWKTETTSTATLPTGYTFGKIVVKAGQNCVEVYPNNELPACYSVSISGQTVSVTRLTESNACQGISHLEGIYGISTTPSPSPSDYCSPSPSPSDSPSPSPSDSPSPSPSDSPSPSPSDSPSPSPSDSPSPSPSDSPSPSPSDSPSPSPSDSPSPSPSPSNSPTPTPSTTPAPSDTPSSDEGGEVGGASVSTDSEVEEGEVLGEMAATGVIEDAIMNMLYPLGGIMTGLGSVMYEKKNRRPRR